MNLAFQLVLFPARRLTVIGMLVLAFTITYGQSLTSAQVPAAVTASFSKSFPGVPAKWQKGTKSTFEATFSKENAEQVYVYDEAGVLQVKKLKSSIAQLPVSVQNTVNTAYPGQSSVQAFKVISRTQEKYYEVQVAQAAGQDRLRFDLEGNPTGKTTLAASAPAVSPAPVASKPAPAPAIAANTKPTPAAVTKPASPPVAMRGESATTPALIEDEEEMDIEIEDDLFEDAGLEDVDDLLEEEDDLLLEEDDLEDVDDLIEDDDDGDDLSL